MNYFILFGHFFILMINIWALGNCGKALGDKRRCEEENAQLKIDNADLRSDVSYERECHQSAERKLGSFKARYLMLERELNEVRLKYNKYKQEVSLDG